jgi:cell envelope-related transcriptional attenuator-like protein
VLVISAGVCFFVRYMIACWQLTALPGIPPASCGGKAGGVQPDARPASIADPASTPEAAIPEIQYPKWDRASRINIVCTVGEGAKLPGGGPSLAMKTVSQFVGVPIQYYVQVDFDAFTSLIDMIGGIESSPMNDSDWTHRIGERLLCHEMLSDVSFEW